MKNSELERYQRLYASLRHMGSDNVLRRYLGLSPELVLPLSVAHGVDMNHCSTAMDVELHEPLHWSCNDTIHKRALQVKASVRLPHPWLMLRQLHGSVLQGSGILVIGPPPGRTNDQTLYEQLRAQGLSRYDVLLKIRGDVDNSRDFWRSKDIGVVTAGPPDGTFYDRLFALIQKYESIVGCTMSSALFFAASIGRKVLLLEQYRYSAYETSDYLKRADFSSSVAREFLRLVRGHRHSEATSMSLELLGGSLPGTPSTFSSALLDAIAELPHPLHFGIRRSWMLRRTAELVALRTGSSSLIRSSPLQLLRRKLRSSVCVLSIKEMDVWLNGINTENFRLERVPYRKNTTEPGWAVD